MSLDELMSALDDGDAFPAKPRGFGKSKLVPVDPDAKDPETKKDPNIVLEVKGKEREEVLEKTKPKETDGPKTEPTKFNKITMEQVRQYASLGLSNWQMAQLFGVALDTFYGWKKRHKEFFDTLKEWKDFADERVEQSLYQRAIGFAVPEDKVFYDSRRGKTIIVPYMRHYPPDSTSMIFWLKNRKREIWGDRPSAQPDENNGPKQVIKFGDKEIEF